MKATCHCGRVKVQIPAPPEHINFCDCTLCAKSGGAWAYFEPDQLKIEGKTQTYLREDYDNPVVVIHFCPNCGTTTHWRLKETEENEVSGLNMKLFSPMELEGIEARFPDGRGWDCESKPQLRRAHGILGKDAFI